MNHKQKVTLARKLQTKEERKRKGNGIFESAGWEHRKQAIHERVIQHEARLSPVKEGETL